MDNSIINQLNNLEIASNLEKISENALLTNSIKDAKEIINTINNLFTRFPEFSKILPKIYSMYQNSLDEAKFVCLFDLKNEEILELIKTRLDIPLDHFDSYNLVRKLNYKLQTILDLEARDKFKESVRETLLSCSVLLSDFKLQTPNGTKSFSVGNWLRDYYTKTGLEKVNALKQGEYLSADNNLKKIMPEQKEKIKFLIDLVEKLKMSSSELGGLEESFLAISPDGDPYLISHGVPEKISPDIIKIYKQIITNIGAVNSVSPAINEKKEVKQVEAETQPKSRLIELEQTLTNYPPDSLEYKVIQQEMEKLKKSNSKK